MAAVGEAAALQVRNVDPFSWYMAELRFNKNFIFAEKVPVFIWWTRIQFSKDTMIQNPTTLLAQPLKR